MKSEDQSNSQILHQSATIAQKDSRNSKQRVCLSRPAPLKNFCNGCMQYRTVPDCEDRCKHNK